MRRLAYTSLLLMTLLGSGCYQRTLAPEALTNEADVQAFRQDMGIESGSAPLPEATEPDPAEAEPPDEDSSSE